MADEDTIINAISERIKSDRDKLQDIGMERVEVDSFNLTEFWPKFESAVTLLSKEVTKVGFMCGQRPFPEKTAVIEMLPDVLQCYNIMLDLYGLLPEEVGAELFKATTTAVINIMAAMFKLVDSFKDLTEQGSQDRLSLTSMFWDACNAVELLPKNNLLATLNIFEGENALVSDALEELNMVNKSVDKIPDEYDWSVNNSGSSEIENKWFSFTGDGVRDSQISKTSDSQVSSVKENEDLTKSTDNTHKQNEWWKVNISINMEKESVFQVSENKATEISALQSEIAMIGRDDKSCNVELKKWIHIAKSCNLPVTLETLRNHINEYISKLNIITTRKKIKRKHRLNQHLKNFQLAKLQFEECISNGTIQNYIPDYGKEKYQNNVQQTFFQGNMSDQFYFKPFPSRNILNCSPIDLQFASQLTTTICNYPTTSGVMNYACNTQTYNFGPYNSFASGVSLPKQ